MKIENDAALARVVGQVQPREACLRHIIVALAFVLALAINIYSRAQHLRAQDPAEVVVRVTSSVVRP